MRNVVLYCRAFLYLLWCAVMIPIQMVLLLFKPGNGAYFLPWVFHKVTCKLFNLKVVVEGTPLREQTLFVGNHVSYIDIPVIGSVLRASFVAKKEVATWPLFGTLARLQQSAFISRSRGDAQKESGTLSTMLAEGKNLILFPEGTSTDGRDVAPFKSSLFSMTLDGVHQDLKIQPVTLVIDSVDGKSPDDQDVRNIYAWYGDLTMVPHLARFGRAHGAVVRLIFHPPLDPKTYSDRKALADHCWIVVRSGIPGHNVASGLAA